MSPHPNVGQTNLSNNVRFLELPSDILVRIAAYLAKDQNSVLALAEVCETLRKIVATALNYEIFVDDEKTGSRWTQLFHREVKTVSLSTPFRTDPPLRRCYPLLTSPTLQIASVRGDAHSFPLLRLCANLQSLSLQIRTADMHPLLMDTLKQLKLNVLQIDYCVDYSLIHLPHAHRCACHPFRRDPDSFVLAINSITNFSVSCPCQASLSCTVPRFPHLQHLQLKGLLPTEPPSNLINLSQHLKTLNLIGKNAPELAASLSHSVTGVFTAESVQYNDAPRRLAATHVDCVVRSCPMLLEFCAHLHKGAENALVHLPASLRRLSVGFRGLEDIRSRWGLQLPKFHPGLLPQLMDTLPNLNYLEISSASIRTEDIDDSFLHMRKWQHLSICVHAQDEPVDERIIRILRLFDSNFASITCLAFQSVPVVALDSVVPSLANDTWRRQRLMHAFQVFARTFPFADYHSVSDLLDDIFQRVERHQLNVDVLENSNAQTVDA